MDESELIARHDLGAAVAMASLEDCRLSFHEQRSTGDVWCVVTGPLGTLPMPLIPKEVFARMLQERAVMPGRIAEQARERYARWQRVRISDNFVVALRARGDRVDLEYLFSDGCPFGGATMGLPTTRRAGPIERARMWLSGQRGRMSSYSRHSNED